MQTSKKDLKGLEALALKLRRDIIETLYVAGSGHPGGSLSAIDIITALYFYKMRYNAKNPKWPERDRFILSKGHGCPAFYVALAEAGFFPREELFYLRKPGAMLQGHPSIGTPGVEISSGSLGQGLSVTNGIALAGRLDKKDYHAFVLLGDGELQEGNIWEAVMTAAKYKLDNLTAIVDRNRLQQTALTEQNKPLEPIAPKWQAMGWHTIEINGHNMQEILTSLDQATSIRGKPTVIIANTVKGKGVSFMENNVEWHGKAPNKEEYEKAMKELA